MDGIDQAVNDEPPASSPDEVLAEVNPAASDDDPPPFRRRNPDLDPPHVATEYFARQIQALAAKTDVRMLETNQVRRLTPLRIQRMLKEQAPDLPVSQTQIYRYFHGESPPRLDVVYELARLFDVPPTYFVPDRLLPEDDPTAE